MYTVHIGLLNDAGVEVSNQEGDFPLTRDGLTDLGVIHFEIQSFHLNWTLAHGSMSLACSDVGAQTVNIVTRLNSDPVVVYPLPCTAGSGSTPAILVNGTYSVSLQLVSNTGMTLWETSSPMTIAVDDTNRAFLTDVRFDL